VLSLYTDCILVAFAKEGRKMENNNNNNDFSIKEQLYVGSTPTPGLVVENSQVTYPLGFSQLMHACVLGSHSSSPPTTGSQFYAGFLCQN